MVRGQVQGVGFRPFVFALARECGLTGFVRNSPRGVIVEVQGRDADLAAFAHGLEHRLPPLARLTGLERQELEALAEESAFVISRSSGGDSHSVLISPDMCVCPDCLADMADPDNRRFRYAFTNCTNCGPRYSITRSIPYDRQTTSMACFPLCPECGDEYDDPGNRRFHAQPNACPACGPEVWLLPSKNALEHFAVGIVHSNESPRDDAVLACPTAAILPERVSKGAAPLWPPEAYSTFGQFHNEFALKGDAAMRALAGILADGGIAAIKGLGGFHLACNAADDRAVAELRRRKHRPHKPFAVMPAGLDDARRIARIGPEEEALLLSPERPVVICPLLPHAPDSVLSSLVSPDTSSVGLMLPYTPLHRVLLDSFSEALRQQRVDGRPAVLVMTSGNPGGEPICLGNREALGNLGSMADAFLLHNRDILIRVDDSVVRPLPGRGTLFYRRARGYVPRPVRLEPLEQTLFEVAQESNMPPAAKRGSRTQALCDPLWKPHFVAAAPPVVLGVGAELKNTLCLTKDGDAFVSQHIGDMSTLETAAFHLEIREHLSKLLKVRPQAVVRDLHPDYLSSDLAERFAGEAGIPLLRLQHHFAHAHAVLAEHRHRDPALVLALDGTGLGEDGRLWGGEVLYVDSSGAGAPVHKRLAHLAPLALPGGEAAIREPWRIAHALLWRLGYLREENSGTIVGVAPGAGGKTLTPFFALPWLPNHADAARLLPKMLEKGFNTPWSTSCGRLFDAVSALLGLCNVTTYEGQAAIRLEEARGPDGDYGAEAGESRYPCPFAPAGESPDILQLDTLSLFAAVYADRLRGTPVPVIARRFHDSLAVALADLAAHLAEGHNIKHVGLSGGCFQNVALTLALAAELEKRNLIPLMHKDLPPGDGCISLGQAAWGVLALRGDDPR